MKVLIVLSAVAVAAVLADIKTCDGEPFDNTWEMCCNGNITERPDPTCVPAANQKCCGQVAFNNLEYQCCDGTVNPRPDGYRANNKCCRKVAFDNLVEICCQGVVNERPWWADPSIIECCGDEAYDPVVCECLDDGPSCF